MKRLMGERSALGSSIVAAVPHPSISTQLVVFADMCAFISVSYTHLTLPTNREV